MTESATTAFAPGGSALWIGRNAADPPFVRVCALRADGRVEILAYGVPLVVPSAELQAAVKRPCGWGRPVAPAPVPPPVVETPAPPPARRARTAKLIAPERMRKMTTATLLPYFQRLAQVPDHTPEWTATYEACRAVLAFRGVTGDVKP